MTPEQLIQNAQNGERDALSQLLSLHRGLIFSVVARYESDREKQKDLVQSILVKVINNIGQFSGLCRFSTWLYRLSLNECLDHVRGAMRRAGMDEPFCDTTAQHIPINAPDGFTITSSKELRCAISEALKKVPLDQKTAFSLFYFGGYSGKEAAEALSISEANFFMKLKAARDFVKKSLSDKGWTV